MKSSIVLSDEQDEQTENDNVFHLNNMQQTEGRIQMIKRLSL